MISVFVILAALSDVAAVTAYDHADAGFKAYATGDYRAAVVAFDEALALHPRLANVAAQRAYALKALGKNAEAVSSFRLAMDLGENGEDDAYKREIKTLEKRIDMVFYTIYREAALGSDFLAVSGPSLTQSQSAMEIVWTPPVIGYRDGRLLQLFGRVLWGYWGNTFLVDNNSWQSGVGIRWKPYRKTNLVFSGERLFAIGYYARNEWMLRASYSWDQGYAFDGRRKHWRYKTFYADIAVIDPAHPDVSFASEARYGESFRLGNKVSVTPHAMMGVVLQKDHYRTTSIIEAGPGLSMKYYGEELTYELLVQYRQKLAGDSLDASGFVLTLVSQY